MASMTTATQQYLGNLRRSLSQNESRRPDGGGLVAWQYRVTAVKEPYIDERLDNCLILERVGQGAMSIVYKAQQDETDRIVAIKMLRAQLCCDPANVKRFQREAKAIARLSHPGLLKVFSVGRTAAGQPFIVMEFVEGRSLTRVIAEEKQIPWQRLAGIFLQVCDAMQHAHAHRIVHRDLKPDNIMLVSTSVGLDSVKVVDFGIVKITDESQALSQKLTKHGEVWGSPIYMSPEQCMGHEIDHRSDIYSLGTVMYECLIGQPLFSGKRITDIVMKQLNEKPAPFSTVRPDLDVPQWFEQVVMTALEKNSQNRFASMEEMKRRIEQGLLSNKDTADSVLKPTAPAAKAVSAPVPSRDPFIGKMIGGKFSIESLIGDGGMSIVYKAIQQGINRPIAIKILRDELCDDQANVKRFQREAKAVSQLMHPNLVSIHDIGVASTGQPYMVMEYLQGKSLAEILEEEGKMSIERALPIFIQICDVMQYAHAQGFVHRDLKPHNVMLIKVADRLDFVKIVDFGIVKLDGDKQSISQKLTAAGEICGSPIYMSPEQVLDEPVDARSDIYSFGIVMYECLAGRPVFGGKKITDVLTKHVNELPTPFCQSCPELDVPPALEGIIFKTLEKRPNNRFQSMQDLKDSLSNIAKRLPLDSSGSLRTIMDSERTGVVRESVPRLPVDRLQMVEARALDKTFIAKLAFAVVLVFVLFLAGVYYFASRSAPSPPAAKQLHGSPAAIVVPDKPVIEDKQPVVAPTIQTQPKSHIKASLPVAAKKKLPVKKRLRQPRETLMDEFHAYEGAYLHQHKRPADKYSGMPDD